MTKVGMVFLTIVATTALVSGCASLVPGDGNARDYRLELEKALDGRAALVVHIRHTGSAVVAAFGESAKFNKAAHDVDTSGLSISGGKIAGKIKVTVNPDLWVPRDGKPVTCAYTIDAETAKGKVTGAYEGTYSMAKAKGAISGTVLDVRKAGPVRFRLAAENAIAGGGKRDAWLRRAMITFKIDDGRVSAVGLKCQDSATKMWMAKVARVKVVFDGVALKGSMVANVHGDGFKSGQYMFELDGSVIGDRAGGKCTVSFDGKKIGDRTFVGSVESLAVASE